MFKTSPILACNIRADVNLLYLNIIITSHKYSQIFSMEITLVLDLFFNLFSSNSCSFLENLQWLSFKMCEHSEHYCNRKKRYTGTDNDWFFSNGQNLNINHKSVAKTAPIFKKLLLTAVTYLKCNNKEFVNG
jgi:hypothetical protein